MAVREGLGWTTQPKAATGVMQGNVMQGSRFHLATHPPTRVCSGQLAHAHAVAARRQRLLPVRIIHGAHVAAQHVKTRLQGLQKCCISGDVGGDREQRPG